MTRSPCIVLPSSTTSRSRTIVAMSVVLLLACGHTSHAVRKDGSAPDEHEPPAPHLRAMADGVAHAPPRGANDAPDLPPTEDVTLDAILAYADARSPLLAVARSTRAHADAARAAASPALPANPELTIAVGPRFSDGETGVDVQASVMQQLEIAGQRGLRYEAADRLHERTDAEIEEARWAVHCDVHAAFHRALVERERASLAKRVATFQEEVLRVVERQIDAGEAPALTLRLAQAEVAQAHQSLVLAEQSFWAARMTLGQLAGWPASQPPNPSGELDEPREPPTQPQLVAVARKRLPSLRAGAAAIREAEARAVLADRESWVNPSVGVQYTHEGNPANGATNDIVLGVVSVPIPGFQANQGERAKARADLTVANAELNAQRDLLEADIARAHSEAIAAAKRTRAYGTEILPRFEENLTLLRRAFELGEIDIMALSVGRERFLRIQSDALGARLDYFVALAGLERVVGVDLWHDGHAQENAR